MAGKPTQIIEADGHGGPGAIERMRLAFDAVASIPRHRLTFA